MSAGTNSPVLKDYDPEHDTGPAPSPCINVCTMNAATGLCDGCLRTLDEIVQWGSAAESYKQTVWLEIKRRQQAIW